MGKDDNYVFHGSWECFDIAKPALHKRSGEKKEIVFEEISFHATPYRWIALGYTYKPSGANRSNVMVGMSLHADVKEINIYGYGSLEANLKALYGEGGYVYTFDKNKFVSVKGLGELEVITQTPIKPLSVKRIDNPVNELRKSGVTFIFFDLSKPENADLLRF